MGTTKNNQGRHKDHAEKKVKILTTHPAGTYVVTETENGKVLEITNPGKFWDTSNYLVIQID